MPRREARIVSPEAAPRLVPEAPARVGSGKAQRWVVGLVGLVASLVFILLAVRHLSFSTIAATWRDAHPFPWILVAVACYIAGQLARGQRCRILVGREATLPFPTACNIVVVGYASNNVLPARLGELVRAGMMVERTGIPISQALTITFVERLLDGIAILALLLVSIARAHVEGWVHDLAGVAGLVFGGATVAVLIAAFAPGFVIRTTSRITVNVAPKLHDRLVGLATSIVNGSAVLRRPRQALRIVFLSFVVWLLESSMFYALFPAFGIKPLFEYAVLAMSVTNLGILVPSSPGFVGPFHFFCSQALISIGVAAPTALGYAVLVHLAFYVPVTLWGAAAVLWYGVEVGATAAMARLARVASERQDLGGASATIIARFEPQAAAAATPALYVALVEALVPGHSPRAIPEIAEFVFCQMQALPSHLRVLLEIGLTGFRVFVRLRYFGSFCALPPEKRRIAAESWAYGRVSLFRQLFRPIKSIALLAYYDMQSTAAATTSSKRSLLVARHA